jgi:hypothetical protein
VHYVLNDGIYYVGLSVLFAGPDGDLVDRSDHGYR